METQPRSRARRQLEAASETRAISYRKDGPAETGPTMTTCGVPVVRSLLRLDPTPAVLLTVRPFRRPGGVGRANVPLRHDHQDPVSQQQRSLLALDPDRHEPARRSTWTASRPNVRGASPLKTSIGSGRDAEITCCPVGHDHGPFAPSPTRHPSGGGVRRELRRMEAVAASPHGSDDVHIVSGKSRP